MQIHIPDTEEYIDVISTTIVGDSNNYTITYKTKCGDKSVEQIDTVVDSRNLLQTIAILENMINNNKYIKFDITIK